jgi:AraC-like DNA-binding protein
MQKAVEYLRQGLSVKETALRVGFSDQNYFSTAFKRIIGHAPSRIIK